MTAKPSTPSAPTTPMTGTAAARIQSATAKANLTYQHLPFDDERLSMATVEQFAAFYRAMPKPILMFCGTGARAKLLYQSALMQGLL